MMLLPLIRLLLLAALFQERGLAAETCVDVVKALSRRFNFTLTSFGAKGDGRTLNTEAFRHAISVIRTVNQRSFGGSVLYIPAGTWITGPFNLTSHMTLYLAKNAIIKASQDTTAWPVIAPLPSYGRGRELPGGRHISFIHGDSLVDVAITGEYGVIDGQGDVWWNMWRTKTLQYTRGSLIGIESSKSVQISNVVLQNAPFWTVHLVYSSNVVVRGVNVIAPQDAPNTDGIVPDSSNDVCIEDCQISNGDDAVSIKSGWDEYGIAVNRPARNIVIRRVRAQTRGFAGVAVGSEVSGGARNILIRDVTVHDSAVGFRLKTNVGRGGVVSNITVDGLSLLNVRTAVRFSSDSGEHADDGWNRSAVPVVKNIAVRNVAGGGVAVAGDFEGLPASPMTDICLFNVTVDASGAGAWRCSAVVGSSVRVSPSPCPSLHSPPSPFCKASFGPPST